jgi:multidrug efflux system membrane fusion protein
MKVKTVIAILVSMLTMAGCSSRVRIEQPPQAVQAQRIDSQSSTSAGGLRFSAVVTPDSQVPLAFRIPGYVISLKQVRGQDGGMRDIAEGDPVSQGVVLAQIRSTEYQDKVHQTDFQTKAEEAAAEKAKLDFERASRLFASDSITKPEFDAARAQYDSTQAKVRAAQAQTAEAQVSLRDTSLVAPFSGDIVKKSLELGSFVGPGVPTFVLANTDTVKIIIGVPDTVVRSIRLGQQVEVAIDAFPTRTFHARISRISSAADTVTRNFDVEVAIPNHGHLLKAGMIGSLQLAGGDSQTSTPSVVVPLSAVVQATTGKYGVFVVSQSNNAEIARLRSIEIGPVNGTDITVANGLNNGDQIIIAGANLLKDGQRVEVLK